LIANCRIAVSSAEGLDGDEMTADPDDGDAGHYSRNVHPAREPGSGGQRYLGVKIRKVCRGGTAAGTGCAQRRGSRDAGAIE